MDTATLVATSDFHSAVPTGSALLAAIRTQRDQGALVVDAGDFFGGNAYHEYSGGRVEEQLLADLYDAVVPGNHDLADLLRLRDPGRFPPVVCANLEPPSSFAGRWEPRLVLQSRDGLRVGIVGWLGTQAYDAVPAAERAGYSFQEPSPGLLAAQRDRLLSKGADVVVGVSHSGFLTDVDLQLAGGPLDIIVAGHCHSPHYHWAVPPRHVVKPPECGTGLLRIELSSNAAPSFTFGYPSAAGWADDYESQAIADYRTWGSEPVGLLRTALPDRRALADIVVGRMRAATSADAFVLNLGTLRAGLPSQVTREALIAAAPFDAHVVVLRGDHQLSDVLRLTEDLGESPVVSSALISNTGTLATTAYLAERLGLPASPADPPVSLRRILTDLAQEYT
ncbi:metallophosphoesterase [Streptomyces sp. NPDC056948]|uniref:metallophosphoesterase n=1 Tax=Streptomyces sp. NPDC056948 TaxID=3345975 RepID=UPI00363A29E8